MAQPDELSMSTSDVIYSADHLDSIAFQASAERRALAVELSGMAQGLGYLFAGTGPFLFGLLHDVSHGWTVPWIMYLGVYVVQIVASVLAGRARYV